MATKGMITTRTDEDLEEFKIKKTYWGRFECPWEKWKTPSTHALLTWKFREKDFSAIPNTEELDYILPVLEIKKDRLTNPPADGIHVTWIGHATLLVQFDGITILTDPVFREYSGSEVAQFMHLGYKRYRKAACQVKDIPHVDVVIVSHDHVDHLDWKSAQEINNKFPDVKWFIGKNGGDLCQTKKEKITDMLWWQETTMEINGKDFKFACTPAQHWCRRSAFDMNKRLWCSWVVKGPTKSFFFAGDTGYENRVFKKIGEKYGPFSISAIPIGCTKPRDIFKYQHVHPPEAVEIHKDVKSEQSIAIHWGTFHMTNEFYLEPPHELEQSMGEDKDKFISLQHGESWVVGENRERPKFMNALQGTSVDHIDMVEGNQELQKVTSNEDTEMVEGNQELQKVTSNEDKKMVERNQELQKVTSNEDKKMVEGNQELHKVTSNEDKEMVEGNQELHKVTSNEDKEIVEGYQELQKASSNEDKEMVEGNQELQKFTSNEGKEMVEGNQELQKVTSNEDKEMVELNQELQKVTSNEDKEMVKGNQELQKVTSNEDKEMVEGNQELQKASSNEDKEMVEGNQRDDIGTSHKRGVVRNTCKEISKKYRATKSAESTT